MFQPTATRRRRAWMAAATVATLAGAAACSGSGNDDSAEADPVESAGSAGSAEETAQVPDPPDPCEFVDPNVPANAAAVVVDMAEQAGGARVDIGTVATRSCTLGSGTDVMVLSTVTYAGEADAARAQLAAEATSDGGQEIAVDLRSLPRSSLVTQVTGLVAVTVLESPTPFTVGFAGLRNPASAVTAAEAVLAAT